MKMLMIVALLAILAISPMAATAQLAITGLYDGPLLGGLPKGVELVALSDIPDLSIYGFGSANNGGGTDGEEFTFPADSVLQGQIIYLSNDTDMFTTFFGFAPTYDDPGYGTSINGDDACEIFCNGIVIDVFGDIYTDGTGEPWDHLDGWAYRQDMTGPDGDVFDLSNWFFSGANAWDGELTNDTALVPMPIGTYQIDPAISTDASTWGSIKAMFDN